MAGVELELTGELVPAVVEGADTGAILLVGDVRYEIGIASMAITEGTADFLKSAGPATVKVYSDARLAIERVDGTRFAARGDFDVEVWEIRGSDGLFAVSVAGGAEVAIWEPDRPSSALSLDP